MNWLDVGRPVATPSPRQIAPAAMPEAAMTGVTCWRSMTITPTAIRPSTALRMIQGWAMMLTVKTRPMAARTIPNMAMKGRECSVAEAIAGVGVCCQRTTISVSTKPRLAMVPAMTKADCAKSQPEAMAATETTHNAASTLVSKVRRGMDISRKSSMQTDAQPNARAWWSM